MSPKTHKKIIIIDQQPIVLEGIRQAINSIFPSVDFLYLGGSITEALAVMKSKKADCIMVDPTITGELSQSAVIAKLAKAKSPVFVLSHDGSAQAMSQAMSSGARGFFPKNGEISELRDGVLTVIAGQIYISPSVAENINSKLKEQVKLSDRERTALALYASGLTMDQVAISMKIASSTANEYIDRSRAKFRAAGKAARTKVDLRRLAAEEGLLSNA